MFEHKRMNNWVGSIGIMALLGAGLGGMGAYWNFFWINRDMCPCAAEGLSTESSMKSEVAEPYSDALMRSRILRFSGIGAVMGTVTGVLLSFKDRQRMRQFMFESERDDPPPPENS